MCGAVSVVDSYGACGDVLEPLAHVGAVFYSGAASLLAVPATVGVPGFQTHPETDRKNIKLKLFEKLLR